MKGYVDLNGVDRPAYSKDGLQIDICYRYRYFEVFGLDDEDFERLTEFYGSMS